MEWEGRGIRWDVVGCEGSEERGSKRSKEKYWRWK